MILLVEDDENIAFAVKTYLEKRGHTLIHADTLKKASQFLNQAVDLILLDVQLPDGNGFQFIESQQLCQICPVIFLTANQSDEAIIQGLHLGADDYLPKPFKLPILEARIEAVLRRQKKEQNAKQIGPLKIDDLKKEITVKGVVLELTAGEYSLLKLFTERAQQTLTRATLLELLWDNQSNFVNDNTLTVTIKRLREKLPEEVKIITLRGIGYRLEVSNA